MAQRVRLLISCSEMFDFLLQDFRIRANLPRRTAFRQCASHGWLMEVSYTYSSTHAGGASFTSFTYPSMSARRGPLPLESFDELAWSRMTLEASDSSRTLERRHFNLCGSRSVSLVPATFDLNVLTTWVYCNLDCFLALPFARVPLPLRSCFSRFSNQSNHGEERSTPNYIETITSYIFSSDV